MNCKEALEKLYAYIDRDGTTVSLEELEIHLRRCRPCWKRCEFEKQLLARFKSACGREALPDSLISRIRTTLDQY